MIKDKHHASRASCEIHFDKLLCYFRFAFRSLRKDFQFAFLAIFALALGVAACTVIFSIADSVFFHALPYKEFDRSVIVEMQSQHGSGDWKNRTYFNSAEIRAFRQENHSFEDFIVYGRMRPTYYDGKSTQYFAFGAYVTSNMFDYLGVSPILGRAIKPEDGEPGAPPVFVMNYRYWEREFDRDPKIVGKIFVLNGRPTTLIGVMPANFTAFEANFWLPLTPEQEISGSFKLIGRLKPGVSVHAAGADLNAIAQRIHESAPGVGFSETDFAIVTVRWLDSLIGNFKSTLFALLAAVFLLLLIACANVANLLLARASTREREMAVRASLGATRGHLIRQLLVESFVLSAVASLAGCVFAFFGLKATIGLIPAGTLPAETVIRMNLPVLLLALGSTILMTILCGLSPALHVVRGDLQSRLASSGRSVGGGFRNGRLRSALVVSEVALSIVLLIGAGLAIRSFLRLTHVDLGFNPKNVVYFELSLPPSYNTDIPGTLQKKNVLTRQLLERLRVLPGVTSVAEFADPPPLKYEVSDTTISGRLHSDRWETRFEMCSDGYFQTLGLHLVRGRLFSENEVFAATQVMVVNEAFSRQYFSNQDPLGAKVKLDVFDRPQFAAAAPHDAYFEIIGIVRDNKTRGYDNPSWQIVPQAFIPYSVAGYNWRVFMARTVVDPNSLLKMITEEVQLLEPGARIATSGTLEGSLLEFYRQPQFELATLAAFATVGLALVLIGVFSVMAYIVSLRTHEMGVRIALGAQRSDILRLMLITGFRLVAAGALIGLGVAAALTGVLSDLVTDVSAADPWTYCAVVALVLVVGVGACLLPAFRATRVDPLVALRYE